MADPYAPRTRTSSPEMLPDLQAVLDRLARCGAPQEDLDATAESWPPPAEVLAWFRECTDTELIDEIARVQAEYDYGTLSDEDLAAREHAAQVAKWQAGMPELLGHSVPDVVEYVDDDPDLAALVLEFEQASDGKGRVTLIDAMKVIIDGTPG